MVARHYRKPHKFKCVTDDPKGINSDIEIIPDWKDFADLPSPSGNRNPSCYRRLRMFHPEIGSVFGARFVSLDLDMVITGDLTPVWDRPEDIVLVGDTNPRTYFNGSMILMTAGARPQVWTTFDPKKSIAAARVAGHFGSDQATISHCLGPKEAKWTTADGVYSYRNHIESNGNALPADARVVICHGARDPWDRYMQRIDWVQREYC